MSLINDVLREVEQRRGQPAATLANPPAPPYPPSPRRRWPAWLFLAAACGALLHWTLGDQTPVPDDGNRLLATADPGIPADTAGQGAGEQLATPGAPSADPASPSALAIDDELPAHVDSAAGNQALARAIISERAPGQTPQPAQDVEPAPPQPPASEASAAIGVDAGDAAAPSPPASEDKTTQTEGRISIERANAGDFGDDGLAGARRALAQGRVRVAESRLRRITREQPGITEAHEQLASLLLRQQRTGEAIDLLDQALDLADRPAPLAALLGRLLIDRGQSQRARRVLMAHTPPLATDPDYHLLLAAAHRQSGDHAAAAGVYRQLGELAPENSRAWIGLGASLESLERPAEAVSAYRRALEGADPQAARFARQRIDALAPVNGDH